MGHARYIQDIELILLAYLIRFHRRRHYQGIVLILTRIQRVMMMLAIVCCRATNSFNQ